jgi:hypothetical protein
MQRRENKMSSLVGLYDRYVTGDILGVYSLIDSIDIENLDSAGKAEIEKVLEETFARVSYNLNIIYHELKNSGYNFKTEFSCDSENPLLGPLDNVDKLLGELEVAVSPFGYAPLSLKMFYKIVGSCDFTWDYGSNENIIWPGSDPIQICSLNDLVSHVKGEYWAEEMDEYPEAFLELSADYLHKDNVSGGPAYSMALTSKPRIDSNLLNETHNTSFINYLRICFENCGFSRMTETTGNYQSFFDKVKPQLKPL